MTPIYLSENYDIFIGLDVDKKSFSFTVKDHTMMTKSKRVPAKPEDFYQYLQKTFCGKRVLCAYEAGPTGYHLYDYLLSRDQACLVVPALSIPKAPNQKVKNNRIDSKHIAEELKAGRLCSIRVPQGIYRDLRVLVKMREDYAKSRKVAKQRIKSLLLFSHLEPSVQDVNHNWSAGYIQSLKELSCSAVVRQRLNHLLMDLSYSRSHTLSTLKELRAFVKNHSEIQDSMTYLRSIPGIGFITAVSLLGRIGDPQELQNVRELSAFVGLVPTENSTGDDIQQGSITHLGNRVLRSLLIESAWMAIRKDQELKQFYHRIKARHHPKVASQKAIVAVARKLTQRIYCVLTQKRMYVIH